uniref:Ankyrin repeat protein n=1 Tax=Ditylum brightwellii TaxID=49249 RepID=A0A7S4WEB8_9STRA|mmetsp:Transcript_37522/g.57204  ORF Transcript_37522/g.57204 Transcript_37522/m.57204 type:complete len:484 (+) Transcript_37522:52-1503(+)
MSSHKRQREKRSPSSDDDNENGLVGRADISPPNKRVKSEGEKKVIQILEHLQNLFNLDPLKDSDVEKFNAKAVMKVITQNPHAATLKYKTKYLEEPCYPLHLVICFKSSVNVVDALFRAYPNAIKEKCTLSIGRPVTPLGLACSSGASVEVLSLLLTHHPPSVKEMNEQNQTLLHVGCKFHLSFESLSLLLETYPNAAIQKDEDGHTPLHIACMNDFKLNTLSSLLQTCPEAAIVKDNRGNTPLHIACIYQVSLEVLSLLLETCPEAAKEQSNRGSLPLHHACNIRPLTTETISLLLQKYKAGAVHKNSSGLTPLHIACRHNAPLEVVSLLIKTCPVAAQLKENQGYTPLQLMCWEGEVNYPIFLLLLDVYPAAVLGRDVHGNTLLDHDYLPFVVGNLVYCVGNMIENHTDKAEVKESMEYFIRVDWWKGVSMALNYQPCLVLEIIDSSASSVFPYLLSMVGRSCKMLTLWSIISNKQDFLSS